MDLVEVGYMMNGGFAKKILVGQILDVQILADGRGAVHFVRGEGTKDFIVRDCAYIEWKCTDEE